MGALLGLVLAVAVTSPASAVNAAAAREAQAVGSDQDTGVSESVNMELNVLSVTGQTTGWQPSYWGDILVRVNCTNNFDGDPTNNTFPRPDNDPFMRRPPAGETLVDGYVYLVFGRDRPPTQRVFDAGDADETDSCVVQQTASLGLPQQVVYDASSDDTDTVVEVAQPSARSLGAANVAWPSGPVNLEGDSAHVTVTDRFPPCLLGDDRVCDNAIVDFVPGNVVRIKTRIRGDAPNPPGFTLRLRCAGRGIMEEHLLTFSDQTPLDVEKPAGRNRCVIKETGTGGADRVEYFAVSTTGADTSFGASSARVDFGTDYGDGGYARLLVTNRFPGTCPATAPGYC